MKFATYKSDMRHGRCDAPMIARRRRAAACLLLSLFTSTAFADQLVATESEIIESKNEDGIEMYSNLPPTPTTEGENTRVAADKPTSSMSKKSEMQRKTRLHESSQKDTSHLPESAMPMEYNIIHELQDPQAPQDH